VFKRFSPSPITDSNDSQSLRTDTKQISSCHGRRSSSHAYREDADVSEAVTAILKNERIDVHVETKCLLVERHGRDMESVAGSPSGIVIRKLRERGHLVRIRERDPATGARPLVSSPPAQ